MLRAFLPGILLASQAVLAAPDPAATSINALGLKLLRLEPAAQNAVLSPFSIQVALAMAWEGARGETREQMTRALDYPKEAEAAPFASLSRKLSGIPARFRDFIERSSDEPVSSPLRLDIACRLFGQEGFAFRPSYLELVQANYGAPLETLDFRNSRAAAKHINKWVEARTNNRIRDLVPAQALNERTRLVLVNAIYFRAAWDHLFDENLTKPLPFRLEGGETIRVPTMTRAAQLGYQKAEGYTAVRLSFATHELAFVILLPDEADGLPRLERTLDAATLARFATLERRPGIIFLPRFRLEPPALSLASALKKLGMEKAFQLPPDGADFDGIAPSRGDEPLFISDVFHKAFVSVDERGTEAAAATAVIMMAGSMPDRNEPVEVRVDRPFLFAIQHVPTGACLFLGRVTDPR